MHKYFRRSEEAGEHSPTPAMARGWTYSRKTLADGSQMQPYGWHRQRYACRRSTKWAAAAGRSSYDGGLRKNANTSARPYRNLGRWASRGGGQSSPGRGNSEKMAKRTAAGNDSTPTRPLFWCCQCRRRRSREWMRGSRWPARISPEGCQFIRLMSTAYWPSVCPLKYSSTPGWSTGSPVSSGTRFCSETYAS